MRRDADRCRPLDGAAGGQRVDGVQRRPWPVVSDGTRVYVAENGYFDAMTRMWALDPSNGHTLWQYNFGNVSDLGQPTVDRGYVYVAQVNNTPGTYMYSFVASTGKPLWSLPINAQWDHLWAPLVTPAGYLYFDGGSYGGFDGLRASDGTQIFFNGGFAQWDSGSRRSSAAKSTPTSTGT